MNDSYQGIPKRAWYLLNMIYQKENCGLVFDDSNAELADLLNCSSKAISYNAKILREKHWITMDFVSHSKGLARQFHLTNLGKQIAEDNPFKDRSWLDWYGKKNKKKL